MVVPSDSPKRKDGKRHWPPPSSSSGSKSRSPSEAIENVLGRLEGVRSGREGKTWMAHCPVHEDRQQSLSVGVGADDKILLNCFAGCDTKAIVAAIGLTMADLFVGDTQPPSGRSIVATYD